MQKMHFLKKLRVMFEVSMVTNIKFKSFNYLSNHVRKSFSLFSWKIIEEKMPFLRKYSKMVLPKSNLL